MTIDAVGFDLDGTLWDTCDVVALAWNRVVERHGIDFRAVTGDDLRRVTGQPHDACIRAIYRGLTESELVLLSSETALEDNRVVAEMGGTLYPGVREGLKQLSARYSLFIVSNCQSGYIEAFFHATGTASLFTDYECWGNSGQSKAENLRNVIARNRFARPVFVGDTDGDLRAAAACDVPFVFVTYGFGDGTAATRRVPSFAELVKELLSA